MNGAEQVMNRLSSRVTGFNGKSVLVIGAGVSGLTSALCLARKGFRVTVVIASRRLIRSEKSISPLDSVPWYGVDND